MNDKDSAELEIYVTAARAEAPGLRADLRARILADAQATQVAVQARPRWKGWFSGLTGHWALPGAAGGVTATVAGFWLGVSAPLPMESPLWMYAALEYLDVVAVPLLGVVDPLAMGF